MKSISFRIAITAFMIIVSLLHISARETAAAETVLKSSGMGLTPLLSGSTGGAPAGRFKNESEKLHGPGFWGLVAIAVLILRMVIGLPVSVSGWKRWMEKKGKGKISSKR